MKMRTAPFPLWYAVGIFFGVYLTVAFSEEFAFRGVVQHHLSGWFGKWGGLAIASVVFGLVHLKWRTNLALRGLTALPITFTPA